MYTRKQKGNFNKHRIIFKNMDNDSMCVYIYIATDMFKKVYNKDSIKKHTIKEKVSQMLNKDHSDMEKSKIK